VAPIVSTTPIKRTARVMQVSGMFDVTLEEKSSFVVEVPDELASLASKPWNIGLIVGPSGAGKSTLARHVWPDSYVPGPDPDEWPRDAAVIDSIAPEGSVRDAANLLSSVGFGSPPAWLRPFAVLSTGEQFRATLARALASVSDAPVVMDEYTSTVDRQVAQAGSHAVQRTVRRLDAKLVAVTCHFDVIDWLQPDWVYRPDSVDFEWRRLQSHPPIELEVREVGRDAWPLFRPHHYLSGDLHVAARCACAFVDGMPVAFCAWYRFPHPRAKNIMVNHRTVTLPDWQGLGIGVTLANAVGEHLARGGDRFRTTTAHPAMIAALRRSPRWRESTTGANKPSRSRKPKRLYRQHANPRKLATRAFEYVDSLRA
jgi:alpha-D-ribose 1-methylphosphonate 5-triphosphate synthase subunit PhnL/GNAT superfamily N-acetyltransferase